MSGILVDEGVPADHHLSGAPAMTLTPDDWAKITAAFIELQPLGATDRAARLTVISQTSVVIASEVASLLEADADDGFLEGDTANRLWTGLATTSPLIGQTLVRTA